MDNPLTHHDNDPFSEASQEAVQLIEHLPQSYAFEQAMYERRTERIATYSAKGNTPATIHLPHEFMTSLPNEVRNSFLQLEYEITELEIALRDTPDSVSLSVTFLANGIAHLFESSRIADLAPTQAVAFHETTNAHGDRVHYQIAPHTTTALLSSFAYAQQRFINGTATHDNPPLELDESTVVNRAEDISLAECIIMTLGNFSGRSRVRTTAIFESPTTQEPSILATLPEGEYPDKSTTEGILTLSEVVENKELTLVSTEVLQRRVNIEAGNSIIPAGTQSLRYATQENSTLTQDMPPIIREIDPDRDPHQWSQICRRFASYATQAMHPYKYLDEPY